MVWVNALVCATDTDVEAERDAGNADGMRKALTMRSKVIFFILVFLQKYL